LSYHRVAIIINLTDHDDNNNNSNNNTHYSINKIEIRFTSPSVCTPCLYL
jgi:hypothetical protein